MIELFELFGGEIGIDYGIADDVCGWFSN